MEDGPIAVAVGGQFIMDFSLKVCNNKRLTAFMALLNTSPSSNCVVWNPVWCELGSTPKNATTEGSTGFHNSRKNHVMSIRSANDFNNVVRSVSLLQLGSTGNGCSRGSHSSKNDGSSMNSARAKNCFKSVEVLLLLCIVDWHSSACHASISNNNAVVALLSLKNGCTIRLITMPAMILVDETGSLRK